ncbi:uncharacterized protein LTHEOB_6066 [Lasiodiplodia theobromae]|uniref:uncharacterized protein n=1 Tax=Lasiodiplodia theobromae TaxID=45133 RepID=UPI0015C2D3BA|nr:uncharacterized protein LTHEOB_6066 [Lasiodiplodia theobromae]KAF4544496.1 hypothetical protein LTHEOB_6066 [Lasiodiplodia theobromae]
MDREEALERKAKATESIPLYQAFKTRSMSRKTRCILAYTLAKSVWQYYGSEWMKYPWTRENIHLLDDEMPQRGFSTRSYLFRPYFAADFSGDTRSISEYIEGEMLWHRYPQVLALGILLIEVAKGKPFEIPGIPLDYSKDSINQYIKSAMIALEKDGLFEKKEDDFDSYRDAVESCLRFGQFFDLPCVSGPQQSRERDNSLEEHRAIIYKKVVQPLKELLKGTRWLAGIDEMKQEFDLGSTNALNNTSAISETRPSQSSHNGKAKPGGRYLNGRSRLLHGKAR